MSESHWRMQLNNYLQSNGGTKMLTWEVFHAGPPHAVVWTAITYIHGAQYAKCINARQSAAMEEAAKSTLDQLQAQRRRGY
ncbi:hypothetical protein PsYK624_129310 [Phanerochaete sordida]|uniref:DRBM domain-containing protein n=1 Tax=Phanerochaete sordida TaxID=48140 RepID=A0A9P3GK80_9APHY|nr:hypothetical protein PsYK624_129310 [Phanerochaete sordida]